MNVYVLVSDTDNEEYCKGEVLGVYSTLEIMSDEKLKRETMGCKCYHILREVDAKSHIREQLTKGFLYTVAMDVKTKETVELSKEECYRDINEINIEKKYRSYFKNELDCILITSPVSFEHAVMLAKTNIDRIIKEDRFLQETVKLFDMVINI